MKICSEEMAAIVFGASAPGGFGGGSSGGFSGGGFGGASSNVSCAGPSASSAGGAVAATIAANSINGDGSFQNAVATFAGGIVSWGIEAGALLTTRNPVFSLTLGTLAGTATANHVNSLDASAGPPTNVDAMGNVQGPEGTRGGGNSSGGGVATGGSGGDASGGGDRGTRGGW